ncbi:hypothetical protein E2C01_061169 [Portunus trituberculatus]|uniref:Uncharacterized protein n=1 Tax=Portunus trituberculatus TaxID=210409 RepID=A0A5B7HAY7_PORTR|nr:hypothetical protein [Portunus trituberculatus]
MTNNTMPSRPIYRNTRNTPSLPQPPWSRLYWHSLSSTFTLARTRPWKNETPEGYHLL